MKKLTLLLAAAMLSSMSFATTFEKVTAEPADWSGEYLLVYENSDTAYVWTGTDASSCYTKHEIKDNSIEATEVATITIATMEGGYSVLVNGGGLKGQYIGGKKTKKGAPDNGFVSGTTAYVTTLEYANDAITMTSHTGTVMAYNKTSGQDRFRYYKAATAKDYGAIQLYKKVAAEVPATAIALDATTWTAEQYKYTQLTATLTPAEATTKVVWTSSDENVATVENGKVTAVGVGSATITATAGEGVKATCAVTVTAPTILTCDSAANLARKVSENNEVVANGKYVVRGYVTEVTDEYSVQYKNLSVWLADTNEEGKNTIQAFRAVPVSEVEQKLAVGDYVEVVGDLTKYNGKLQLAAGCSIKKLANPTTAIDITTLRTPSVKTIENGQLVIIRDGVKYNAMGVRLQ